MNHGFLSSNESAGSSSSGSSSRLPGSARREFAILLNNFWKQLFDYYGEPTEEAKNLDKLLETDSKVHTLSKQVERLDLHTVHASGKRYHTSPVQSSNSLRINQPRRPVTVNGYEVTRPAKPPGFPDPVHYGVGLSKDTESVGYSEANLLLELRLYIIKILKLEGSNRLFQQNAGLDEDLVDFVAARERYLSDQMNEGSGIQSDRETTIPNCGRRCVYRADLITSFGVWCIHRVLMLSLRENRPEFWGKYTYVLNRLQGIIERAFHKPRAAMSPCHCLQLVPTSYHQETQSKGKYTTAADILDMVKNVENAIAHRKGPAHTPANRAFVQGKINLTSVLERYKSKLTNKKAVT